MGKWYKNLKIATKVTGGFLIVALIAGIIGAIGIFSLEGVDASYKTAYQDSTAALECLEKISSANQKIRGNLYKLLLAETQQEKQEVRAEFPDIDSTIEEALADYKAMLVKYDTSEVEEETALIAEMESRLQAFQEIRNEFVSGPGMKAENWMEGYAVLTGEVAPYRTAVDESIDATIDYNNAYIAQQIETMDRQVRFTEIVMITAIAIGVVLAVLIGILLARNLSRRIRVVVEATERLSEGNLDVHIDVDSRDEIGVLAESSRRMSDTLKKIISDLSRGLEAFAGGNFAMDSQAEDSYVGDYRPMLDNIRKMRDKLSNTLSNIGLAAEQVSTGSEQVSAGAQALASGSTEQAAAVEELGATVEHISDQARGNLDMVGAAAKSIRESDEGVTAGNRHMEQLTQAMAEVSSASSQIASITKVIEDIAFQTNILALNAAIEAARAGNAGKGFAVVADEVRTLAAKSAEAAKQTAELIENSVSTVARGTELTNQTAQILKDVDAAARQATESFGRIERSISEQTGAIEQIREGLSQISSVVQTNAATAEENSATSEEMSAQAVTLRQEVQKFRLWEGEGQGPRGKDNGDEAGETQGSRARENPDARVELAAGKY
ncbi:MAG: methyl-accepting chemotaxis protein [Oscillibacter sp.]|nr:methyl-accepting chemotaxis protein [Oscillibacter sp.]MEA4993942.1 methyl-accepting chemotaxis protein [Oscillibacter sp.]